MGVSGGFAKLKKIAKLVNGLPRVVVKNAAASASPEIADAIQGEFAGGTDAYGSGLQADKAATFLRGTSAIFMRSGSAAASATAAPSGVKIRIKLVGYMKYHISTKGPFFPPKGGAKPTAWNEAIKAATSAAIKAELTGA